MFFSLRSEGDQRAGTPPVRKGRERDGIVQDGEEKGLGKIFM